MDTVSTPLIEAASAAGRAVARRNRRLRVILAAISLGMLGFGFGLIEFYPLLCRATGVQTAPNNPEIAAAAPRPTGRIIEVFFEKKVFDHLPVRFFPDEECQHAEVGIDHHNVYHFKNLSARPLHFRPIHQISPPVAGKAFGMKLCFCFNDQVIAPGETKDFEVVYTFAPELHESVTTVQICYSLHEIEDGSLRGDDKGMIESKVEGDGAIMTPGYRDGDPR
jgi:cytochrome c oxidase assembly protein subunit 11